MKERPPENFEEASEVEEPSPEDLESALEGTKAREGIKGKLVTDEERRLRTRRAKEAIRNLKQGQKDLFPEEPPEKQS